MHIHLIQNTVYNKQETEFYRNLQYCVSSVSLWVWLAGFKNRKMITL